MNYYLIYSIRVNYPSPYIARGNNLYKLDIIGPRHLKGESRFYSINTNNAYDRKGIVSPHCRQNRSAILGVLLYCWRTLKIPQFLQLDNLLPLRRSSQYSHSFGIIIRFCLYLKIQYIFIPIREPRLMELSNIFSINLIEYFFEVSALIAFWIYMKNPGSLIDFITSIITIVL